MEEIDRMLNNWAKWRLGDTGGPMSCSPLYHLMPRPARYGNVFPILNGEAQDLDKIINGLADERLKRVIPIHYLWNDTQEQKAKRCGCCVNTYKTRLEKAKEEIKRAWYRRSTGVRTEAA